MKTYLTKAIFLSTFLLLSTTVSLADGSADASIRTEVSKALSKNPYHNLGASVKDGDITLTGTVNTASDLTHLVCRDFSKINGVNDISTAKVTSVNDDFSSTKDFSITTQIRGKTRGKGTNLSIFTNAGCVWAVGTVDSSREKQQVMDIINKTDGVHGAVYRITIE